MTAMPAAPTTPRRSWARSWGNAIRVIAALLVGCALALSAPGAVYAGAEAGETAPLSASSDVQVGVSELFWTQDWTTGAYSRILATAQYVGEHAIIYVSESEWLSSYVIEQLGTAFDDAVYPALTEAYGSEPNPGVDGEPRVYILIYDFNDPYNDIDGSFDFNDIDPRYFVYSNQKEMFYLNLKALISAPNSGAALAAHEFAHLITYYRDVMLDPSPSAAPEPAWVAECFSTYAEHLAGYDDRVNSQLRAFGRDPAISLTNWQGFSASYGASYSFIRYLAGREAPGFVRALLEQPLDGVAGINAALAASGSPDTFTSLFDDWVLAGLLDGRAPELRPYCFDDLAVSVEPEVLTGAEPVLGTGEVADYSAQYLDFPVTPVEESFQAVIDGEAGAPLQAALVSWDSTGALSPAIARFDLQNEAVGGTVTGPTGYDRHTVVVWARGVIGSSESYEFTYSGACDPPGGVQFLDLGGSDPFYAFAAVLLNRAVISGKEVPQGSGMWYFNGKDNVLRAQFAKMIMKATRLHTAEIDHPGFPTFSDVPAVYDDGGYPYDYVEEAAALGIVNGYSNGTFGPSKPITRSQLVLMITRGAAAAGRPLPAYTGSARVFADVPLSHPYYRQIMAAYTAGILGGSMASNGKLYFYPYAPASRNHVAKMTATLVAYLEEPTP